jgi:PKD repeat protein
LARHIIVFPIFFPSKLPICHFLINEHSKSITMITMTNLRSLLLLIVFIGYQGFSQVIKYSDTWGKQGLTLVSSDKSGMQLNYSLEEFEFEEVIIDGSSMKAVRTPAVFLPNEAGAPDLPVTSRYIVIPGDARASVKIIASRTELIKDVDVAPAPVIPLDTDRDPLKYQKNTGIYSRDAFYPENPVMLSENMKIRGVDAVMVAITPFQYNPVTRELIVYRDLKVEIVIEGGNGKVGDDRLRSRFWDPVVKGAVLNQDAIPEISWQTNHNASRTPDYEYVIITPNSPDFIQWADSIKVWRTLQGISTGVVTTSDIGGNTVAAIKSYIDNAYNTWDVPPVAVLLLGDYSTGTDGINSMLYTHPGGYPDFASDNYYADVNGDNLPDIVFARITARNATELQVMTSKFLNYERNPPSNADFYDKPVTALGWQTERWFQICSETISGYLKNVKGKHPVRINALYIGDPAIDPWSTAINTSTVLNYFGPSGTGYIPATPQELGGFTGGTGANIVTAINDGAFMVMHRDHGMYTGWGEPYFTTTQIGSLTNINNELPFVFSINCQTGAFHQTSECFAEKFHRKTFNGQNSGALGVIAPTEVSYSFVNDTYIWGVFDNMFPDFMPSYSTQFPTSFVLPAFGNAAGKYFLYQSSWPYNSGNKLVTYRLFHHQGDAFTTIYTEVPQTLAVSHASTMAASATSFSVTANAGSTIALTVNGQILAVAAGTGAPLSISIPPQNGGQTMIVTVTKQNYYRHSSTVQITTGGVIANFSASPTSTCAGQTVTFTDLSVGSPTTWNWSFPGGNPGTWQGQNPPGIVYNTAGTYNVSLTAANANSTGTETKNAYIIITALNADFSGTPAVLTAGQSVIFSDLSTCNPTSYQWSFPGGNPATFAGQTPPPVIYSTPGIYNVSLTVNNGTGNDTQTYNGYITVNELQYCQSHGMASQEWIASVGLNGDTQASGSSGTAGYQDFTGTIFSLPSGSNSNITLATGYSGTVRTEYFKIWIDFNQDMDFNDSGEEVFSATKIKTTTSGTIAIPAGLNVTTVMRVSMKRNAFSTSCEIFTSGEVEDYTVVIAPQAPPPPVADFSGTPTSIGIGQVVQFNDLSTNNPTTWSWSFPGGIPATSNLQNPVVTYNGTGSFDVSLTVTDAEGQDTELKTAYIAVTNNPAPVYCEPVAINNQQDYINTITIGTITNSSGKGSSGFIHYTSPTFNFTPGQSYNVSLSPFSSSNRNFWRIWIDMNADGDFTDADEILFTANNKKGAATGSIIIPAYAAGTARMRISMKTSGSQASCDDNFSGEVEDYNVTFGAEDALVHSGIPEMTLLAYPNPADGQINIQVTGNSGTVVVRIYSSQGLLIKSDALSGNYEKIDLTGYQTGIYFIIAGDGRQQVVEKIILK